MTWADGINSGRFRKIDGIMTAGNLTKQQVEVAGSVLTRRWLKVVHRRSCLVRGSWCRQTTPSGSKNYGEAAPEGPDVLGNRWGHSPARDKRRGR